MTGTVASSPTPDIPGTEDTPTAAASGTADSGTADSGTADSGSASGPVAEGGRAKRTGRTGRRWLPANRPVTWFAALAWLGAIAVCLPAVKQTINTRWTWDGYLHAGVLRDIATYGLNPTEPIVGGDAASPYFSPYSLVLGFVLRMLGGDGLTGLALAAAVNGALLVLGVVVFTRTLMGRERPGRALVAPLAIILFVLLWGFNTWSFSGLLTMNALGFVLPYPSTVGIALMLLHWTVLIKFLDTESRWRWVFLALVAVLASTIAITHAFSAICDVIGLLAVALHRWRRLFSKKQWLTTLLPMLGAVAAAAAMVYFWPYYEVFKLSEAGALYSGAQRRLYEDWFVHIGLGLLCVPLLLRRWWRDKLDPVVIALVIGIGVYAGGWWSGLYAYSRVLTLVMLCAHLGAALELGQMFGDGLPNWRQKILAPLMTLVLLAGCALGLAGSGFGLVQAISPDRLPPWVVGESKRVRSAASYGFLNRVIHDGDMVLANRPPGSLMMLAYGGRLLVSPYPDAFTPDSAKRQAAVDAYYWAAKHDRDRPDVLAAYRVKWVVFQRDDGKAPASLGAPVATGPDGFRIYRATAG